MTISFEDGPKWSTKLAGKRRKMNHGDRRQELVIIGQNLKPSLVTRRLDAALVTQGEFDQGWELWKTWIPEDDEDKEA